MDMLVKLFGSKTLVKVMRLFLFNPEQPFDKDDVAEKTRAPLPRVRWALSLLEGIGMLKPKSFSKEITRKRGKKETMVKKRTKGWIMDESFSHVSPLRNLLINTDILTDREIKAKLSHVGALKLVLVSGVFIHDRDSRLDILVVGDKLKKSPLDTAMKELEAVVGTELRYAVFETHEFTYRMGMYDKLIRDALDFRHRKIINRLGL